MLPSFRLRSYIAITLSYAQRYAEGLSVAVGELSKMAATRDAFQRVVGQGCRWSLILQRFPALMT